MNKKTCVLIVLFVLALVLLGLISIVNSYPTTKDVVPVFKGCAAESGQVTEVAIGETVVEPVTWHCKQVYLIPNGENYTVSWTSDSDLLGLGPDITGSESFTAASGCPPHVNYPEITVSYTVQVGLAVGYRYIF